MGADEDTARAMLDRLIETQLMMKSHQDVVDNMKAIETKTANEVARLLEQTGLSGRVYRGFIWSWADNGMGTVRLVQEPLPKDL